MKEHQVSLAIAVAASLISAFAPSGAHGATIFRDQASWESGIATASTIDFSNDYLGVGQQTDYSSGGLTDSGVHFSSSGLYVITARFYHPSVFLYTGSLLTMTLPAGTTAVGMTTISAVSGANNNFAVTAFLADSSTVVDSYYHQDGTTYQQFWGITSDSPISSLTFSSSLNWLGVDDFSFGTVPEPHSAVLILLGGAICLRRRATPRT